MAKYTVIHVDEEELRAVKCFVTAGKITILAYHTEPLPDGCVRDGQLIDKTSFQMALHDFSDRCGFALSGARLLLGSGKLLLKSLTVPDKLQKRELLYTVRAELSAISGGKEYRYDYSEICPPRGTNARYILCGGMERESIQAWRSGFQEAGISLAGIETEEDAVIHLAERVPELSTGTVILCLREGRNVISFLFAEGSYLMHSRSSFPEGLLGRINMLCQLSQSRTERKAVSKLFTCGFAGEEAELQVIAETFGIPVSPFSLEAYVEEGRVAQVPYEKMTGILAAVLRDDRKRFDFLAAEKMRSVKTVERLGAAEMRLAFLGICAAVLMAAAGAASYKAQRLERELEEIRAFIEDEQYLAAYSEVSLAEKEAIRLETALVQAAKMQEAAARDGQPDSEMFVSIEAAAGEIECFGYHYSKTDGTLCFTGIAGDYRRIPKFVDRLKASGHFLEVTYTGYLYDESAGGYRFEISVVPGEGGEADGTV